MPYIYDILKSFRKNDLLDVGAIFGFDARSSCRKDEILDRLSSYIQDQPEKWLSLMLERDLNFLNSPKSSPVTSTRPYRKGRGLEDLSMNVLCLES